MRLFKFGRNSTYSIVIAGLALSALVACGGADAPAETNGSPLVTDLQEGADPVATPPTPLTGPITFMAMSDIHYEKDLTTDGGYCDECETSDELWNATQTFAKQLISDEAPDFLIFTGDLPAHRDYPGQDGQTAAEIADKVAEEITTALGGLTNIVSDAKIPVIMAPGNNDAFGGDYCSFTDQEFQTGYQGKQPFDLAPNPANWPVANGAYLLPSANVAKGYYSVYPYGAPTSAGFRPLRVIALNTVIFASRYSDPACADDQQGDANAHLEWFINELADAKTANDTVLLTMHVPPGTDGYGGGTMWSDTLNYTGTAANLSVWSGDWAQKVFLEIIANSGVDFAGFISGHTHTNDIRRIYDCADNYMMVDVTTPGVTTDHGNLPAMKIIRTNADYQLATSNTYFADVAVGTSYTWSKSNVLSFRDNYPCTTCSSTTLSGWIGEMSATAAGRATVADDMFDNINLTGSGPSRERFYKKALDTKCVPGLDAP